MERLREDPDLDYAALRRVADAAGITMQPIQYGRARKQLGLPPLQAARADVRAAQPQDGVDQQAPAGAVLAEQETEEDREAPDDVAPAAASVPPAAAGDGEDAAPGSAATSDIVPPRRKGSPAFDFLVQELRRDGTLNYGTLRASAEAKGFRIAPIMYGRAKAVLGLVPVKARGQGAKKAAAAAGVPRVLKQVESVAADRFSKQLDEVRNLDQLVSVVKDLDAERRRLRGLLERIVAMIDEALG